MLPATADVVIVGAGNAALCAALAAAEHGVSVLVLERAPEGEDGGNSRFTAGAFRCVYDGAEDLKALMPDLTPDELGVTDFGTYTEDQFFDDMGRVTEYRADPELLEVLVRRSRDTMRWMHAKGVRFAPIWGRQAFKVDGRFKFWGGLTVEASGGGPGLVAALTEAARKNRVTIAYAAKALSLVADDDGIRGIRVRHDGRTATVATGNVVLAAGGFQANAEWRTRYLGPGWDLAKVRGTRFNTGDGIRMALDVGAQPTGNWSGCHAVGWDRNAPEFGDLAVGDNFQKHSYPFGIMLNAEGERFVDEGADFRNYTYAKYGRVILGQPGQFAWQVFDAKVLHLLRDEYRIRRVTKARADTLEELVQKLDGRECRRGRWRPSGPTTRRSSARCRSTPTSRTAAAPWGWRSPSPTGPTPSRSRRSRPTPSPAASPSPSAASRSTPTRASSAPTASPSPASTRPARWWAACSTSTIRAAPGS